MLFVYQMIYNTASVRSELACQWLGNERLHTPTHRASLFHHTLLTLYLTRSAFTEQIKIILVLHSQSVGNVLTYGMKISQTCLLLLMLPDDFFFALISERKCLNNTATYCGGATTEPNQPNSCMLPVWVHYLEYRIIASAYYLVSCRVND